MWDLDTEWIALGGEVDGPTGTRGRQLGTWTNGPQVSHPPSGAGGPTRPGDQAGSVCGIHKLYTTSMTGTFSSSRLKNEAKPHDFSSR